MTSESDKKGNIDATYKRLAQEFYDREPSHLLTALDKFAMLDEEGKVAELQALQGRCQKQGKMMTK